MSGAREEGPAFRPLDIVWIALAAIVIVIAGWHFGLV
jgi:hypothetical protein